MSSFKESYNIVFDLCSKVFYDGALLDNARVGS